MEIELPETEGRSGEFERVLTILIGIGAILAALLVNLELASGRHESRSSAEAARLAVVGFRGMTSDSLAGGAMTAAVARAGDLVFTGQARQIAAKNDPVLEALARANALAGDKAAAAYLRTVDLKGTPQPNNAWISEVRTQLARFVQATGATFNERVKESNAAVDAGARYARRGSRATLALAVLASAGALFGLAGVLRAGRAGWLALVTGAAGILIAAAVGVSAITI